MKHLIISREYPPPPGGGIGTYVHNMARLLAQRGETVHVIGQLSANARKPYEEQCNRRLIIHRLPFEEPSAFLWPRFNSSLSSKVARALYSSHYPPLCFSWLAGSLAERLVEEQGIDLIEAQDYEAPLYYFQLRRALGLGPKRRPPCFVHLHSPTEFTARHNDWDLAQPSLQVAKRIEDYSILAADALLCPSRFLARQALAHYGVPNDSIEVIPYPLGELGPIDRDRTTWAAGSVCYVGRLEKRKGILDWLAAAVQVARCDLELSFEFVGGNALGPNPILSAAVLDSLIPQDVSKRFIFHGRVDRTRILQILKNARIVAVPSRWDNFPNTCMEALATGLPVIASPEGGMTEMVVDGETGWIAEGTDITSLTKALMRALETPAPRLALMGNAAARHIQRVCGNDHVLDRHMSFRGRLSFRDPGSPSPTVSILRKSDRPADRTITLSDVVADYPPNDGARVDDSLHAAAALESLEHLRQSVAHDARRIGAAAFFSDLTPGGGWNGRAYEPISTIRYIIRKPRAGFRALRAARR